MAASGYVPSNHSNRCYKRVVYKNDKARSGNVIFVSACILQPGGRVFPHFHVDMIEHFVFESETKVFEARQEHSLENTADKPLKFICIGIRV
jgi:mannose-6-phosphate isomerase-like protein (cupin superfamily)